MELVHSLSDPNKAVLLRAARDGHGDIIRNLLAGNPDLLWAREPNTGETALHLAVSNNHEAVVRLLLEKGANPEVTNHRGWRPLALTASVVTSLAIPELLLQYGANVESVNSQVQESALHLCAETGFLPLARILLDNGAQVDFRDVETRTPLIRAIVRNHIDMVELLLEYGAAKDVRTGQGNALEDLASDKPDILRLLRTPQILQGPKIAGQEPPDSRPKAQALVARLPPPLDDLAKITACHVFKAHVVDFYLGESEKRIQQSISVYDAVYGAGARSMMSAAQDGRVQGKPSLRWYHLPANNMEWVEALMRRHFAEHESGTSQYTNELATELGTSRSRGEHHLMFTTKGSFIRPFCRELKATADEHGHNQKRHIAAFIPYLHYETYHGFLAMSEVVSTAFNAWAPGPKRPTTRFAPFDNGNEGEGLHEQERPISQNNEPARDTEAAPHPVGIWDEIRGNQPYQNRQMSAEAGNNSNNGPYTTIPSGLPNRLLIQGYLKPGLEGKMPPLQLRRTLDHYFYSHLASTSKRDGDQVVLRYTSRLIGVEPKIFMVDQLWLWILDEDTVISCSPLRWDSWATQPLRHTQTSSRQLSENFVLWENDPLNIHQVVMQHLQKVRRQSIASAEDLCRVIVSCCVSAFDPYGVPEHFHFFDFMERAIGDVADKTTEQFQEFRMLLDSSAAANELLSATSIRIELETQLLVEVEDIRDELGILRLVLEDQKAVVGNLDKLIYPPAFILNGGTEKASQTEHLLGNNRVLESHLDRIERMETLTKRCIQSIRSLLKLKQQHASLSEAQSARKQAEFTTQQTHVAALHTERVADQLAIAQRQAQETAKQGNIIMLFTVVTVVFLPLSFMTSFFTIELDAFPLNENGRMPLSYVLSIILAVSAGVSIPFILMAFNFDVVLAWPKRAIAWVVQASFLTTFMIAALLIAAITLAVVLSQPLALQVKVATGIGIGLLVVVALGGAIISKRGRHAW